MSLLLIVLVESLDKIVVANRINGSGDINNGLDKPADEVVDKVVEDFGCDQESDEDHESESVWELKGNVPLSTFQPLRWDNLTIPDHDPEIEILTPWQYWQRIIKDIFFQIGAEYTSRYYLQHTGKAINITSGEIKQFFGLRPITGVIKFPRIHMYWSAKFHFPVVSNMMNRDSSGTILEFKIYQGATTNLPNKDFGMGPALVLRLVQSIPERSFVYLAYFTTVPLKNQLIARNIYGTGTIMTNRIRGCEFKKDKDMKRGESEEYVRSGRQISVTEWKEKKRQ
ncbi:Transposase IS4 [Popillia japonica]|uniref:Transposase IS4 n=1 Tax=Popillia japonica TaxID=7064 RepID=A0AAW1IZJ0_POPJA